MDPAAEPLLRIRQGAEASIATMSSNAHFFAMLEVENRSSASPTCCAGATRSTWPTPSGSCRPASPTDRSATRTLLLALGVVGSVAYYGHFHRTRRADLPVDELAAFVGRYVVRALAADEEIAARVLRA